MKAKGPTRHKPVTEEDAGSSTEVSTDDISDCLSRLAICSTDSPKPTSTQVSKEKEAEKQKESNEKDGDKRKTEKAKPKDEEKEESEKEDVLLSRGPENVVHKYRSQATASQAPYPKAVHQVNHTHGGCTVYEQSPPSLCSYLPESCNTQRNIYPDVLPDLGLTSDFFESSETSLPINIGEYPPVGASIPDENISKIIEEVVNDPQKMKKVVEDLLTAAKTATLNIDLESSSVPHHSPESCQVVPQRHPSSSSAYSTSSGSPPGPSSPNYYGKTPIFSPNVPSPQVGAYDESHMYSPPYCSNFQSPLQRPLSSCSSSSTNCSSADLDFDLNVMIRPTDREKERKVVEELEKDLPASNSDTNLAYYMPSPLGPVPPANNPTIYLVVHDNLQLAKKKTDVTTSSGNRTPRPILPKLPPSGSERSPNHSQDIRGWMPQSRMTVRQSCYQLPMQEQLLQRLDPMKKQRAWTQVMSHTDEKLTTVDDDGDTPLMILVCSSEILQKLEQLHALVERYKKIPGALALRNNRRQSALYMACILVYEEPLVAKYIAEALLDIDRDLDVINEENGNSLIHYLCQDDKYSVLLDGLLSMKNKRGRCCFDFNRKNHEGQSPLHLAVETHNKGIPCLRIVKVLLQHGADILTKDGKQGSTALHLALSTCAPDKDLIQTLCNYSDDMTVQFIQGKQTNIKVELVNSKDLKGDTPMHIAMAYLGLMELQNPNHVIEILLKAGAVRSIRNNNGKVPLELAPENHKVEMKRMLDKYNVK